jgi:ferric-dicitrate binding protein FerR (iron transport regulator)
MTIDITKRSEPPSTSDAGTTAADWLIELSFARDIGPLLPDFRRWLDADSSHRSAFAEVRNLWDLLSDPDAGQRELLQKALRDDST